MSKTSAAVVLDFQLVTEFNSVRERLLGLELNGHWEKPLAYWAQGTDRHLPMALVDKTLRYVVDTPFKQLSMTPGIGPKKLSSLIMLMSRAANSHVANGHVESSPAANGSATNGAATNGSATNGSFANGAAGDVNGHKTDATPDDSSAVSEALWSRWRTNLRSRGLAKEGLGRFAPSLRKIPRLMWRKRLDDYLSLSLAEIRALPSHGEKRLAALVEIVGGLNQITEQLASQPHVVARIEPRLVAQLEDWFAAFSSARCEPVSSRGGPARACRELPDDPAVCRELVGPLVEQARVDVGDHAAAILQDRLLKPQTTVQRTARQIGLTRGRVYELVSEAAAALEIRWPQGRQRLLELRSELADAVDGNGGSRYRESLTRVEVILALLFRDRLSSGA
jgi:hypothetical protein